MEKGIAMTDLSVVIVNWNTRQMVLDCIGSIYQTAGESRVQVILVDNASEDGSVEAVRQRFPSVVIVENRENLGFARGNNVGIALAEGRYVCLVNSDVVILDDCLQILTTYMDAHPDVGIIGPKLLWKDRTVQWSCRKFPSLWNTFCPAVGLTQLFGGVSFLSGEHMGYFRHDSIRAVDVLVGAFLMVRREALEQVGSMDESFFMYSEEVDWCRRFRDAGWKIFFHPEARVIHYGGGSSSKAPTRFYREYCLSTLRYWQKHHAGPAAFGFRVLFLLRHALRWPLRGLLYGGTFFPAWRAKRGLYKEKLNSLTIGIQSVFSRIKKPGAGGEYESANPRSCS